MRGLSPCGILGGGGLLCALATLTVAATSCTSSTRPEGSTSATSTGATAATVDLQGAGATFPYPLYSKWVAEHGKAHPSVRINYQSIGSGGGIRQILERTVDFGATDAPMTAAETAKAQGAILHLPMTLGAVAVVYNVPGVARGLKLTPAVLAEIFLGKLKTWNAEAIVKANPGVKLPGGAITVVYRSDGSGTTSVLTEYLAKVSAAWKEQVGAGKSVRFPTGLGAKGNEGVSGQVKTSPGSIGYVELAYAEQTGLTYAAIRNRAGAFVMPSLAAVSAAAAGAATAMPDDLRVSIVDAEGSAAYPISAFTYILVYRELGAPAKAKALARFLWWAVHEGQQHGAPLHYAPLPAAMLPQIEAKLRGLRAGGQPVLP